MFLHFRVFIQLYIQPSVYFQVELFESFDSIGSNATFVCSRHEGGLSLHSCGPSPYFVTHCILQEAPFSSYLKKAVLKLIACILPPCDPTGRILVSTMDTLLQCCSP